HLRPLLARDPLDVAEKSFAPLEFVLFPGRLSIQPSACGIDALLLARPFVPSFAVAIFLHQRAEEGVTGQPGGFLFAKSIESWLTIARCVRREIRKRFFEQSAFQFFYRAISHRALTELRKIDIRQRGVEIFAR